MRNFNGYSENFRDYLQEDPISSSGIGTYSVDFFCDNNGKCEENFRMKPSEHKPDWEQIYNNYKNKEKLLSAAKKNIKTFLKRIRHKNKKDFLDKNIEYLKQKRFSAKNYINNYNVSVPGELA